MNDSVVASLEHECEARLRRHLEQPSEETLHSAYELGRSALGHDVGVIDMGALLLRAMLQVLAPRDGGRALTAPRQTLEAFVLEVLSPFEMAHRGAHEATAALRRIDEVREDEIRRIGHELHDTAGQMLASVHLALDDLARDLGPRAGVGLERAKVLLVRVEEQLRRLSHEFLPPMLDDLGLGPALEYLAEVVTRRTGIRIEIQNALVQRLPPRFEIALYRIVQEAITNVRRHARASRVLVVLERNDAEVACRIEDDGVGFEPDRPRGAPEVVGLGLKGIRERAARLGGTLDIRSGRGTGTSLTLSLPWEMEHALASADRG